MSQTPSQNHPQPHRRSESEQRRATSKPATSAHASTSSLPSSLSSSSSKSLPPSQIPQLSTAAATAAPPPATPTRKPKTPRASGKGQGTDLGGGGSGGPIVRPSPPSGRRTPISPEPIHSPSPTAKTPSPPPPPTTPTPAQKSKREEMDSDDEYTNQPASRGSVTTTQLLKLTNDRVDRSFKKAWRLFDPNGTGQINNAEFPAFINTLEELVGLPKGSLLPKSIEKVVTMRDKHGNTINIDQEATNELLKRLEIPNGNTGLLDYVRMRLKEQENRKKDLTEEDVLSRSTVEGSYTDDSTGGLDLPSTGPVRGTTPSPGRRGATPSPGRSNQPKLSDQLLGPRPGRISAFVDPNDSTIYKVEEDLEQSVLLRNTDLAPKAASQRDPEEIARVYAEVRRLKALVSLKETALKDLQETAEDWDKKFLNIERSKDSMHSEFDRTMSVLVDERDKLEADLERVRAEFREAKDTKDREIRALKEQVRAQQADIYQLEEEASQVKAVQPKRDTVRENKLSDEIEDLVAQLVEEKNKTRLMESRILNYAESQAKHLNELADIQQELKSLKELLAEKDEENDRLGKFIFDLEDTLEAAAAADKASTTAPAVTKKPATAGITQNPGDFGMGSESSGVRYEESPEYVRGPFEDSPSRIPAGIRRKQSIDHTVYMHWAGREVQTDIEIPPGEERLVSGCVAWLQDPTLAAINELKQQIPEVVEEASSNDAECQTAEAWPKPITVEEEIQRQQAEMEDYGIQRRQAETEDHGTQAELAPTESAVPASYPEDHYQETIITDNATRTLLYDLTMKSELTLADRAFLNDFVMKQSTSPNREILHNVWKLAQPAARALRMAAAKTYNGSSAAGYIFKFHRIHGPMGVFAWPLRLLWDAFHGLDQADYYASTNPRGGNEQAALDSNNLSTESADSAANPQPKPKSAPRGRQATLLRAGPWPGLAWSILTAGLYLFILILLLSNLHMYRSMKQEQNLWVRANEPSPARFMNPGFRRVCHSSNGWGWRWRELIMVWVNEQGRSWPA